MDETGNQDGQSILFLHGFSLSGLVWHYQLNSDLADDFRLVALDNRGHGRSEKPEDGYDDPSLWADDIQAVITDLELDDPAVVAASMSGVFLCDYLSVHGEDEIAGINLVNAVTKVGPEVRPPQIGEDFIELIPAFISTDADESIAGIDEIWRRDTHEELSPRNHHFMVGITVQTPPYVRSALIQRSVSYDELLPSIESSVLLTHGEEDTIIFPHAAEEHAEALPNARRSSYPEVGHSPFLETPDRFNRELREFVGSV